MKKIIRKGWGLVWDGDKGMIGNCSSYCPGTFCESLAIYPTKFLAIANKRHKRDVRVIPLTITYSLTNKR